MPQATELPGRFIVATASDWGQGKTDAVLDIACGLAERGFAVGGVVLRRIYTPTPAGFVVAGMEGLLLRTGESVALARVGFADEESIDLRSGRREGLRIGLDGVFYLNSAGMARLLQGAATDLMEPSVGAYILDEIGPLLFKAKHAKRKKEKRTAPFYRLALRLVDRPKPLTIIIFSDPDMQAEEALGVRKHIQVHPTRLHDRVEYRRLNADNFRVLAGEILEGVPAGVRPPSIEAQHGGP